MNQTWERGGLSLLLELHRVAVNITFKLYSCPGVDE